MESPNFENHSKNQAINLCKINDFDVAYNTEDKRTNEVQTIIALFKLMTNKFMNKIANRHL